jgi:rhodanese-related sulfurtransferase
MTVHEVREAGSRLQILDVRTPSEWNQGHVPGAHHIFLPDLRDKIADLDRGKPIAVYRDSGYRASIAASILKQQGFKCVYNIPGSWQAWHLPCPLRSRQTRFKVSRAAGTIYGYSLPTTGWPTADGALILPRNRNVMSQTENLGQVVE